MAPRFVIRHLTSTLLVSGLYAGVADAQRNAPRALTGRFLGAAYLQVSEPKGDFGQNTGNGFGINASGLWRLDPSGIANVRVDAGFLVYGSNTRRIDFANTGGLVKLDLRTTSSIFSMVGGPQLGGTTGAISPYVAALGGFSAFWTESSVEGSNNNSNNNQPFASTTNSSDVALAYGMAGGLAIRLGSSNRPVRLDLGARYLRHDEASYLNDKRVEDGFRANRDPIPLRGRADFVTYYLGASVVVY
jgi:hypothetical protein